MIQGNFIIVNLKVREMALQDSTLSEAGDHDLEECCDTLGFGQYTSETYLDVVNKNISYCRWLVFRSASWIPGPSRQFCQYLLKHHRDKLTFLETKSKKVTFGKYRGKSFNVIMKDDPSYCDYLMTDAEIFRSEGKSDNPARSFQEFIFNRRIDKLSESPLTFSDFTEPLDDGEKQFKSGKQKGRTYQDVFQTEPGFSRIMLEKYPTNAYSQWLRGILP